MLRGKNEHEKLGTLGSVFVGLLVLVAIGGAYSLRSYPIPVTLARSASAVAPPSQSVGNSDAMQHYSNANGEAKAIIASIFEEACRDVVNNNLSAETTVRLLSLTGLTPEGLRITVAYFGSPERELGSIHAINQDFLSFVRDNEANLHSPELLTTGVDCKVFAFNMINLADRTASLVQGGATAAAASGAQVGMGGLLGSSLIFPKIPSIAQTLNVFGVWLQKALKSVVSTSLKFLPTVKLYAPRRRRKKLEKPKPRGCLGCISTSCIGCDSTRVDI